MARVLVVDRERLVRETIGLVLTLEEHEPVLAQDGAEAIRQFRSQHFDLVVCDVFLPDLSGLEVIRAIRGISATTPIIAMSAGFGEMPESRFSEELVRLARQNGATDMLPKPFRRAQLTALVKRCIER